jgi:hypothetical protein
MSKEQQLFDLATMTSNAFGISSELAGFNATKFQNGDGANMNIHDTCDEYANAILTFSEILTEQDVADVHGTLSNEQLIEARELIAELQGYDADKLKRIAREDWAEQEEEDAV